MRLICYPTSGEPPTIVPAPISRPWMDATAEGWAYRCLPLNIANAHGWLILNTIPFVAEWNGNADPGGLRVTPTAEGAPVLGMSHFGHGVLTFSVTGLFRTEPGYDLMVTGPTNQPKDAIQALTGVVETDWSPFTFTMNWRFTRIDTPIAFDRGEPFCMIFPVRRGLVEAAEPEFRSLAEDPEVQQAFAAFNASRANFITGLKVEGSEAQAQKWQKEYFRGVSRFGNAPDDHKTKLKLKDFKPIE